MKLKHSEYQIDIFYEWENTNNNICVEAAPGSGKSHTLLELLKRTPRFKKSIFLAFNRSIKEELEKKVPQGVETSTLHSLGFRTLLKNTNQKYKLSEYKNYTLGKKIFKLNYKDKKKESIYLFIVSRLVDLYRLNCCETKAELIEIADKYNISTMNGEIDRALELIDHLSKYNTTNHDKEMLIDFVDMLYLPVTLLSDGDFNKYDNILIDEGQDLNALQWILVQKLFKKRSRFCLVGDGFQAIYSFMGSDKEIFQNIKNYPNTTTLPLSYSYRCAKNIVKEANKVFDFIQSPEWKEDGEVINNGSVDDAKEGDFILCRNNAPLIECFLYLLKQGKKCHILGRDYGKGLLNVLNKIEDFSKESIDKLLNKKLDQLKEKGVQNPTHNQSYQNLVEKIFILSELHKEYTNIQELKDLIEGMFSDDSNSKDSIIMSTIHKSKGLESDNVYFLYPDLLPSQYAETETEQYAEKCLRYVCITRAKKKLVYVNSMISKKDDI